MENLLVPANGGDNAKNDSEFVRNVRRFVQDDTMILSQETLDSLQTEITCPICLGVLDKTWTVMACVHRFCFECFHRILRVDKPNAQKECPLCRLKLASRRDSKPDYMFDHLIHMLTGKAESGVNLDLESVKTAEYMSHSLVYDSYSSPRESTTSKSPRRSLGASVDNSSGTMDLSQYRQAHEANVTAIRMRQAEIRQRLPESPIYISNEADDSGSKRKRSKSEDDQQQVSSKSTMVAFSLQPRVDVPLFPDGLQPLAKPFLRAPSILEVRELKLLLIEKDIGIAGKESPIEISVRFNSQVIALPDSCSLRDICVNFWDRKSKFELFYNGKS